MQDGRYLETIEMLAATIAHEVKNPLSLIQANIDFIELCDKEKKHSKNYSVIREELRKTNEMLGSFIELIRVVYKFEEEIAIYDIIMNVVENYKQRLDKVIAIEVLCPDKNLLFKGNFQLFTMAVSNIVKNAIEAIENTGVINISVFSDNGKVIISIKDNGIGVTEEILKNVNKQEGFTTKKFGSGIGINICKNIVLEHKGTFEMKNGDDGGCVVVITVPAIA